MDLVAEVRPHIRRRNRLRNAGERVVYIPEDIGILADEQPHDEVTDACQREMSGVSPLGVRLVHGEKRGQEKDALGNLLNGRQHRRARYSVVDLLKHALEKEHRITSLQ